MKEPTGCGTAEVVVSVAAFLLGLYFLFSMIPAQIEDYSTTLPNAKTFPYALGGLFTLLCLRWIYTAVRNRRLPLAAPPSRLVAGVLLAMLFFGAVSVMEQVGYLLCGALLTTLVILAIECLARWRMALVSGISITLLFFLLFTKLLHIELPAGIFTF